MATIHLFLDSNSGTYQLNGTDSKFSENFLSFQNSNRLRGLSNATLRAYAFDLLHLARWLKNSKVPFRALDQARLLQWVSCQRELNAKPKSINRRLAVCHIFYRFCFNREIKRKIAATISPSKPAKQYDDIGLPIVHRRHSAQLKVKVPRKLIETIESADVGKFIESFFRYRDLAIVLLMMLCGLRSGEVLRLRIIDLNFHDRTLRIRGKGGKERMMPMLETVSSALRRYLHYERPKPLKESCLFVVLQGEGRGRPMTPEGVRSLFRARRRSTGLHRANPHKFRHFFGTEMARAGVPLPVLKNMMGHSNIQITLQYIQLSMADISTEYDRAANQLKSRYEKP